MTSKIHSVTFDCSNPAGLARFWMAALGYVVEPGSAPDHEDAALIDPHGHGPRLMLNYVPEGKTVKNRVHLDIQPHDSMDAEVARLEQLGARRIKTLREPRGTWTVMHDPEGNEFCVERGPEDRRHS